VTVSGPKVNVTLDGLKYWVEVLQNLHSDPSVPRIIVPAYQPNAEARKILKICIEAIRAITKENSYELWIVDNHSPQEYTQWLRELTGVNVVLSHTEPVPSGYRSFLNRLFYKKRQIKWGSYANAVGIELALRMIPKDTRFIMPLHMDTMPCAPHWLDYLMTRLSVSCPAAGMCMEKSRHPDGVLHVLGFIVKYPLLKELKIDFYPDLPGFDVGDKISFVLRRKGYSIYACQNTYEKPELIINIDEKSPLRNLNVVRVFDDEQQVIFLHLGRGIPKANGRYQGKSANIEDWFSFADYLLPKTK